MSLSTDISTPEYEDQIFGNMDDVAVFIEIPDGCVKDDFLSNYLVQNIPTTSVKEELKQKIQNRRLSEGKPQLRVTFSPPPDYKLTPEEEIKQDIRKHRNRRSARKSREKRKAQEDMLMENIEKLETEHRKLKDTVEELKKKEKAYRTFLANHLVKCPKYHEKVKRLKQKLLSIPGIGNANKFTQLPTT